MHTISVNGQTLHYQLEGPAHLPLIVFSNSLGTDFRVWEPLLPHLRHQFRFLRYDKRGHGLSSCPPAPYQPDDHTNDLIGLLDTLALDHIILCGLSVGGQIALDVAARRPDLVQSLILCDTAHRIGTVDIWNSRIDTVRDQGLGAITDEILDRWFSPQFHIEHGDAISLWRQMLLQTPKSGYLGTCTAIRDTDLEQGTRHLTQPTLCVVGAEDRSTPPDLVRTTAELIPNGHFEILEGAGHLPCIEQPSALAALMMAFLSSQQLAPSRYELGMSVRRSVLGEAHVDRAEDNKTTFDEPFQRYITESAWGAVWSRPILSMRDRSLLTIALMGALGHEDELAMHIRATLKTGASQAEVRETLLILGVYAGVPTANTAFRIAKETYKNLGIAIDGETEL